MSLEGTTYGVVGSQSITAEPEELLGMRGVGRKETDMHAEPLEGADMVLSCIQLFQYRET